VVVCNLGSTSLMSAGSLYIFDKHIAYHNPGGAAGFFLGALQPVKMMFAYTEVKEVRVKEEYVTAPGVVLELKSGKQHWWGGMMFPTAVCEAVQKAWKGKSESTAAMALAARSQAALTAASKQTGKLSRLESDVNNLQGKVGDLEAEVRREQCASDEVGWYELNAVDPQLESAWFQPSSLSSEKPVSSLCFQMQLVPLRRGARAPRGDGGGAGRGSGRSVRRAPRRGPIARRRASRDCAAQI
jgi:hypothetical protein